MRQRIIVLALAAAAGIACMLAPAHAATCSREDFAQAVDKAAADMRKLNAQQVPLLQAKVRKLKEKKGWPDAGYEEKAYEMLQDERISAYDVQASDLMGKIDDLGTLDISTEPDCTRLAELTAASLELQATVKARSEYSLSKLDQMLDEAPPPKKKAEPKKPPQTVAKQELPPAPQAKEAPVVRDLPPPVVKDLPQVKQPPAKGPQTGSWSTETQPAPPPGPGVVVEPAPTAQVVPPLAPDEEGYSIQEILAASEGLFGKVSANLAAVVEHLFSKSGRPTAYVLGGEGGGAFLAGVRYGKGTLYMRSGATQTIYWHGPSVGTDVGAEGSKTLFLVYKLTEPSQLYSAFTGIDGSAYLVGGVGATLVGNGHVVMAPIRSGLGLRLGANIGYIRFTPHKTWNPF